MKLLDGLLNGGSFCFPKPKVIDHKDLDLKIEDVEHFSIRTRNALRRSGYVVARDLRHVTFDEIARIKNLGMKSQREVEKYCLSIGIPLQR